MEGHLLRAGQIAPPPLPSPQRQIVHWLHALPPSAERNRLLQYFEARPLSGPDLQELRRLWRERSSLPRRGSGGCWPSPRRIHSRRPLAPPSAADLECIAWVKVIGTN